MIYMLSYELPRGLAVHFGKTRMEALAGLPSESKISITAAKPRLHRVHDTAREEWRKDNTVWFARRLRDQNDGEDILATLTRRVKERECDTPA